MLIAKATIEYIEDTIIAADKDNMVDTDTQDNGEILTIWTHLGEYIVHVNKHFSQIWLSSPMSGAYHFSYDEDI
jgi:frataxin-like iron-binding protein CyaY